MELISGDLIGSDVQSAQRLLDNRYGVDRPSYPVYICKFVGTQITSNTRFTLESFPEEPTYIMATQPGKIYFVGIFDPQSNKPNIRSTDLSYDIELPQKKGARKNKFDLEFPSLEIPHEKLDSTETIEKVHDVWMALKYPDKYELPIHEPWVLLICFICRPDDFETVFPHRNQESKDRFLEAKQKFKPEALEKLSYYAKQMIEYLQTNLP